MVYYCCKRLLLSRGWYLVLPDQDFRLPSLVLRRGFSERVEQCRLFYPLRDLVAGLLFVVCVWYGVSG